MNLYYRNPGQSSEFVIDGSDPELFRSLENDLGDSLSIASEIDHIRMGARVRAVSDSGDVLFIGSVVSIEYSAVGGQRRYDCIAAEALLQYRYAPEIIYPGGVGLTLSDIFSPDAPSQGAGATQYCMGLLWLSRSKICDGQDTGIVSWDSDGVGTLEGWGPLVSGHDIYYGGHKLAESTLSSITGGTYRYAISGDNLYVRGAGTGDIYDVIAADGWTENHVRLGTVATDSEVEAPYEVGETEIWGLIRDLVGETGQYVVFRREEDYVYLDISATPKSRGSETEPVASLHIGDDFSLQKISPTQYIPYSCVVGMGAGAENIEGVRYARGELLYPGQAWLETTYQLPEARLPPWGHLDQATDDFYDAIHQHAPVEIDLYRGGLDVGDWIELDLEGGEKFAAQIRSIRETIAGEVAVVGAPDLSLLTAFLERQETAAIEAYRDKACHSASISTDSGSNVSVTRGAFDKVVSLGYGYIYDAVTLGDGVVVAPTYGKRIIKSDDWGETWRVVFDNMSYSGMSSIAKWNNNILIVGATYYTGDFLYSEDAGESWEYKGTAAGIIHCIATFPGGIALAGNSSGQIYRSTDYGANWSLVYSTGQAKVTKIKTWSNGYCLASTDSSGNVYRSTNYGANWSLIFSTGVSYCRGLATWGAGRALVCGGVSGAKMWRTTDYGANWSSVYSYGSGSSNIIQSVEVDELTGIAFAGASIIGPERWLLYCDDIDSVAMKWTVSYEDLSGGYPVPGTLVVWPGNPIVTLMIYSTPGVIYKFNTDIYTISYLLYITSSSYTFYDDELKLLSLSINTTDDVCAEDSACTAEFTINYDIYILRLKPAYGNVASDVDITTSWNIGTNIIRVKVMAKGFGVYEVHVPSGPADPSTAPPTSMTIKGIEEIE
jgi:hypothetical protein